ncbi:hypothetical protein BKA70DRAFT_1419134 [Coprinopsis sp. MPI-PUGE-AT-0042]|nr:hypothetical protein BKA70DRAFT_1419134 [Coprinopsis sp. MPI-PUGE-AT-0042]
MRFLWGFAVGHTYTWQDQKEESLYFAKLEDIVSSVFPRQIPPNPLAEVTSQLDHTIPRAPETAAPLGSGNAEAASIDVDPTHSGGSQGLHLPDEGKGNGDDEDGDEDEGNGNDGDDDEDSYESDSKVDQDGEEDPWDLLDDEEVILYDDMYHDWYCDDDDN